MFRRIFSLTSFKLTIFITIFFAFLAVFREQEGFSGFFEALEYKALDAKFKIRGNREPSGKVVIAAIDEKSVRSLGVFPWQRDVMARFLDALASYNPKVVAFDITYAEPSVNAAEGVLSNVSKRLSEELQNPEITGKIDDVLSEIVSSADPDAILAASIKKLPHSVLGYFYFPDKKELEGLSEEDFSNAEKLIDVSKIHPRTGPDTNVEETFYKLRAFGIRGNIPVISAASNSFGYFNFIPDDDGIFRHMHMLMVFKDKLFPSLSLSALSAYYGKPIHVVMGEPAFQETDSRVLVKVGEDNILPVGDDGDLLLNFYGPTGTIKTVSVIDIVNKAVLPEKLKDKVVIIGPTAKGIYDLRPSPFSTRDYPGVELHGTAVENVLNEDYLLRPSSLKALEPILLIVLGIALGWLFSHVKLNYGLIVLALFSIGFQYFDLKFIFANGYWLKSVFLFSFMWVMFIGVAVYRYMTEEREKGRIRKAFSTYVTRSVVDAMLKDTTEIKLGGQGLEMTVLFSDIRGFTSISERLKAEDLVHLLNEFLTPMTHIIFKHEGTLDKYMGDAIMAFWGAPISLPNHAELCCRAGLEMMQELHKLRKGWKERDLPSIDIGIGISTGHMTVGNMGSDIRFEYTVIGDTVNLGSRLEGLNKLYGTHIITSEITYEAVKNAGFTFRELDAVRVKGKKEPIRIFELAVTESPDANLAKFIERYQSGLGLYRAQKWDDAISAFRSASETMPSDKSCELFISRSEELKANPPGEGWDGVAVMTTK